VSDELYNISNERPSLFCVRQIQISKFWENGERMEVTDRE
jgi:hypothetical protein